MRICEPAKAYFVILVVYFIIKALFKVVTVQTFIVDLVVALFWTWILSILCRKKMKELAWAFVLLPFVIIGSSFIYGGGVFREGQIGQYFNVDSTEFPSIKNKLISNNITLKTYIDRVIENLEKIEDENESNKRLQQNLESYMNDYCTSLIDTIDDLDDTLKLKVNTYIDERNKYIEKLKKTNETLSDINQTINSEFRFMSNEVEIPVNYPSEYKTVDDSLGKIYTLLKDNIEYISNMIKILERGYDASR